MGRPRDCEQHGNNIFDVQRDGRITKQETRQGSKFTTQVYSPESLNRGKVDGMKDIQDSTNQEMCTPERIFPWRICMLYVVYNLQNNL